MPAVSSRRPRRARALAAALLAAASVAAVSSGGANGAAAIATPRYRLVKVLRPLSRATAFKASSSRLAQSDPALLRATSSAPVNVIVKLDFDGLAAYRGGLRGLAPTSPSVTGRRLGSGGAAEAGYRAYVGRLESQFEGALRAAIPSARVLRRYTTVYGGAAVTLPANRAATLVRLPNVVAVQRNALAQPLTDSSPSFIGATTIYPQLGGAKRSGNGVIVGVLDTGLWPEHPSFADDGSYPAPPPRADGQPRACNYGDNPLTPAVDVFRCNNKVIGGEIFNTFGVPSLYADSARDSDGHGTHTSSTAAGGIVDTAPVLGVNRGPVQGIAPGAAVIMYKVCQPGGCFTADTVAAVQAAIDDGVNVVNYSISGGVLPLQDPTELAFLDAYAAGVFVSASAGNEGPAASTANHLSPWVTTVAASTQSRAFEATVELASSDGSTATVAGASITAGIASATPVVQASDVAGYSDPLCLTPLPAGSVAGAIVVCQRGTNARVEKGYNVLQGGAAGMLLVNGFIGDTETDTHWLPAVHLDGGGGSGGAGDVLANFLASHPDVTARWDAAAKVSTRGDVMAAFSSRGPAGDFLKPDVTAPGVQILAGRSPTVEPGDPSLGPNGEYFQAIAGTSMSAPHVAGAGALLKALHPTWTPGQIKSALMTTATQSVVKEDGVTPADPFDDGAGRIDLTKAGDPGLTISDSASNMFALASDPNTAIDVNLPSVNAGTMPGELKTVRTVENVTGHPITVDVTTSAPDGARIRVTPARFTVAAGATRRLEVTISAPYLADGQYFGEIDLAGTPAHALHVPVAFTRTQPSVTLSTDCERDRITTAPRDRTACRVTAANDTLATVDVQLDTRATSPLQITRALGAKLGRDRVVTKSVTLAGKQPGSPSIAPGSLFGYLPLADFGVAPDAIGDEEIINYGIGGYSYAGGAYDTLGVVSNGYAVAGGGDVTDVDFVPTALPDPAKPNNILAPFWTDLDGTAGQGIYAAVLQDTTTGEQWAVIEWNVLLCCNPDTAPRIFQTWIGLNGVEDITYAYDPGNLPAAPPASYGLTVGAENLDGSAGGTIAEPVPTHDYRVTSTGGAPGETVAYKVFVKGTEPGTSRVVSRLRSAALRGITITSDRVRVVAAPAPRPSRR